ncbi:GAP family protein [Streptomyces platensis]|uniref:GAP family protein n=1 Tax=Streptomyces platensis TaxID=58346 RepID=UPI002E2606C4
MGVGQVHRPAEEGAVHSPACGQEVLQLGGLLGRAWPGGSAPGSIDRLTPVKVFGLGLALAALNAKNAPLTIAAGASIGSAGLPVGQQIASLAIFVLIATLGLLAPLGVFLVGGGERTPHSAAGKTGQPSTTSP